MDRFTIIKNIQKEDVLPIGINEKNEMFGLKVKKETGTITHILGKRGQGKTVMVECMVLSQIIQKKSGLLIDPYGDMVDDILPYLAAKEKKNIQIFKAVDGSLEKNIENFKNEINLDSQKQNFVLCKLHSLRLDNSMLKELGAYILKQYVQKNPNLNGHVVILDEAQNYLTNETVEIVQHAKKFDFTLILSSQTFTGYTKNISDVLKNSINNVLCYDVDVQTAQMLTKTFTLPCDANILTQTEQYHFHAFLAIKKQTPQIHIQAQGIYPIPYKKCI